MVAQVISADVCGKMVEAATRSCQPIISVPPEQANPNWDAMAASFASLSNAFAWGSLILALVAVFAGFTWGRIITARAEREAVKMAEAEVRKWLRDEGIPMLMREMSGFMATFKEETPISESDIDALVAAAGADGKEGSNG